MTQVVRLRCDACGHQTGRIERGEGRLVLRYRVRRSPSPFEVVAVQAAGEQPDNRATYYADDDLTDLRARGVWPDRMDVEWLCDACGARLALTPTELEEATAAYDRSGRPPTLRVRA